MIKIEISLDYLLHQIIRGFFGRSFVMLESVNVHPGQVLMLHHLSKKDGLSQKELAEKLFVKPSTITVMINRMEAVGYVKREADIEDKRITRIIITEKGKEAFVKVEEIRKELEREALRDITEEEKAELKRLLLKIKGNLHKEGLENDELDFHKINMRGNGKC